MQSTFSIVGNERDALLMAWVEQRFSDAQIIPASTDASFRRYFRLLLPDGQSRILMDAPPGLEDCRPFIRVAELLLSAGLHAPRVLEADLSSGILLLSDLGDRCLLTSLQESPSQAARHFDAACQALVKWQRASRPNILPVFDDNLLRHELSLFTEWFIGRHLNYTLSKVEEARMKSLFDTLVERALAQPRCYVHRDFMPRNLMLCDPQPIGILDFQDAVYGPVTYDVVSLFRDAFVSWPEEKELIWVQRYWQGALAANLLVHSDFEQFWHDYEWMGMQRHMKILGIFCRLYYRDGKANYIGDLPRFLAYIHRVAERYADLHPLPDLLDRVLANNQQSPKPVCAP